MRSRAQRLTPRFARFFVLAAALGWLVSLPGEIHAGPVVPQELKAAYVSGSVLVPATHPAWKTAAAVSLPLLFIDEPKWSYKVEPIVQGAGGPGSASPPRTAAAPTSPGTSAPAPAASVKEAHSSLSASPAPAGNLSVKAIYNGSEIAFLLTWTDAEKNDNAAATERFADGASIAFDAQGSCHMGSLADPTNLWNVWYWRADRPGAENLLAAGVGTITRTPERTVSTLPAWTGGNGTGSWSVVFSRALLATNPDNEVVLSQGNGAVRFARWNGAQQERDGRKWITDSVRLTLRARP